MALLKKNQIAFELIFYWGLVGASQAILTPDSDLFELKIFFIYSQTYHSALIFAVLWLVIKCNMRMQIEYIPRVVLITNLVVVVISVINYLLDSNYMFLRVKPNSVSPFLIGDWPVYAGSVTEGSRRGWFSFLRKSQIDDSLTNPLVYHLRNSYSIICKICNFPTLRLNTKTRNFAV